MKQNNWLFVITLFIISVITSACQPVSAGVEVSEPLAVTSSSRELLITATNEGYEAASTIPAGWTTVSLTNQSEGIQQAGLYRLSEGMTVADVPAALASAEVFLPEGLTPLGGPVAVPPGTTQTVAIDLAAGNYVVMNPVPGPDGIPAVEKGYLMALTVEEADAVSAAPEADMTLTVADYAFIFDYAAVTAGQHTIAVTNQGPQEVHEVVFVRLNEGVSVQDFLASFGPQGPEGPLQGLPVAGTAPFDTALTTYVDVEFEAGATYGVLCLLPSTQHEGQPHFMLGMVGEFTVPSN